MAGEPILLQRPPGFANAPETRFRSSAHGLVQKEAASINRSDRGRFEGRIFTA
jgi:hypothetical protein